MTVAPPATPPSRRILLADCDQFFVRVARLADPDGAGQAPYLMVGGSAEGRGVIASCSYECRAMGVHAGMPTAHALRLCPQGMVVPVPSDLCGEKSRAVRAVIARWAPRYEAASIDEVYCDLGGTEALYREPLEATAQRMRQAILEETGIVVSVGGGTGKMIAKMAAGRAKPKHGQGTGVFIVPPGGEEAFLRQHRLADIPFVGPKFVERLTRFGLVTVEHALAWDLDALTRTFGAREGLWLHQRIRGIDHDDLAPDADAKSISHETTFPHDLMADDALDHALLRLVTETTRDLRDAGLQARTVTVRLRDMDFTTRSKATTVPEPVQSERIVLSVARDLLRRLRNERRTPARLLGVRLSSFAAGDDTRQLGLFDHDPVGTIETERDRRLAAAVDRIRHKFGGAAVLPSALVRDTTGKPGPPPRDVND